MGVSMPWPADFNHVDAGGSRHTLLAAWITPGLIVSVLARLAQEDAAKICSFGSQSCVSAPKAKQGPAELVKQLHICLAALFWQG